MTPAIDIGRVAINDIEELQQVVRPWDVILRQMSPGPLQANMDFMVINGLLLYREHWSHRITATGATPAGYFFFGGPVGPASSVNWCGAVLGPDCIGFGRSSSDVEFFTSPSETHVCLLVPEAMLIQYLGADMAEQVLPTDRVLSCHPGHGAGFLQSLQRILDKYLQQPALLGQPRLATALEWQVLGGLLEYLLTSQDPQPCQPSTARYRAVRQAIAVSERLDTPIPIDELAAASGVSRRVLELGFRDLMQTTPGQFMRCNRMNRVRRDLLKSCQDASSVTNIVTAHGVTELGRFAVEYKKLFGESPSHSLRRSAPGAAIRMSDLL